MVSKYGAIFGNRKFNSVFTRPRHWSLSQARLIQSTLSLRASLRPVQVPSRTTYIPPDNLHQVCTSRHLMLSFWFSGPCPNSQAWPPLVDCLLLLIQYIRSYSPQQEAVCSIRNPTSRQVVVTRNPINMIIITTSPYTQTAVETQESSVVPTSAHNYHCASKC